MSKLNTFRELAIETADKQTVMVDSLTEEAPILAMLPMEAASNGIQNKYEELMAIEGAQFVDLDGELPSIGMDSELRTVDLSLLGGVQEVGEDKLNTLGKGAGQYFDMKLPSIMRETGMNTETSLIYNNIRAYAKTNSKLQDAGGTNSGAMYSMLCVKWVGGETTGLYNATGWGNGKVFDMALVNAGNLHYLRDGATLGYAQRIKSHIGVQLANPRYVSGIANIDLVADPDAADGTGYTALPSEAEIDQMILDARGNPGNTFIYMHPKLQNALNVYKGSSLRTEVMVKDYDRTFDLWNGIPIISSYNFLQTEATDTDI
jgi:hypothetical protein